MRILFFLLISHSVYTLATIIDERKIDVYFANEIVTERFEEKDNADLLDVNKIKNQGLAITIT